MRDGTKAWWILAAALLAAALVGVIALATLRPAGQTPAPSGETPGPSLAGPIAYIEGFATAGPVCPVVQSPSPSECRSRPVAGAVIVASHADQGEVARATTAPDGSYRIAIHGFGTFTLTALPIEGLMGAPEPVTVNLNPPETRRVDFEYDTGIR